VILGKKREMGKWIKAEKVPKSWEGQEVWQWNEWQLEPRPFWNVVPKDISREPHHCKGVWYMKFVYPNPPRV
jgi:hypothetical protein